jgi:hypothetical protein
MVTLPAATEPPVGSFCDQAGAPAPTWTNVVAAMPSRKQRLERSQLNPRIDTPAHSVRYPQPCLNLAGGVDRRSAALLGSVRAG